MANSPSRGAWRCTRHRKSCSRSSSVGTPNECTRTPRGLRQPATCLIAPSLPALSRPCSTMSTLFTFAPHIWSCRSNSSSPSLAKRWRAASFDRLLGGSTGMRSSWTFAPRSVKTTLVFRRQLLPWKQRFIEAEAGEVADAHRVEDAVEMVDLVLHDTGMEVFDVALEFPPGLVETRIAQLLVARHDAAHARHGQAAFPALFEIVRQRRQHRVDEHGLRHRLDAGIARIGGDAEDHHAQRHADLRRGKPGAVQVRHGVAHIA